MRNLLSRVPKSAQSFVATLVPSIFAKPDGASTRAQHARVVAELTKRFPAASGTVSARDAAITLLALTTGLRACDIVNLQLGDIDWRARTASIVQQKTNNPLTVPLTDLLVGRLADYVLDQRPASDGDHLFLRSVAPHARLADHASIYRVIANVFGKAGVTDAKAGTRLLRHNAASRLLRAAVPLPTISAVLGHSSLESTNLYLSADRDRLLECVLDVPEPEGSRS